MLINETKLSAKDNYKIKNYTCERYNRDNAAGGVMILIKNNIPYKLIKIKNCVVENVCIKLANDIHIIAAYNRPSIQYTTKDLDILLNVSNKVLLVGDLNSRHKAWNCHINNANGRTLYGYSQMNNCSIMFPDEPTHYPENGGTPTTIDIIINKKSRNITETIVLNELNSDHRPLLFKIGQVNCNNIYEQEVYKYKRADWNKFRSFLNSKIVINNKIYTKQNIDQEVLKFTNSLEIALKETVNKANRKREDEDLPEEILNLIKTRNRNRRIWQRTRNLTYKDIYKQQINMIKVKISNYRNEVWRKKLSKINIYDKSLWRMTKIFKKKFQTIPTLEDNNIEAFSDDDKAEMIATQYEKVHSIDLNNNNEQQKAVIKIVEDLIRNKVENIEDYKQEIISPKEINNIIKKLPSLKAPGKDGIQNIVLKNISRKALVQLMYITNAIIKLGYFPQEWKKAIVIPILKPRKDPTKPSSYRPISLLSSISKVVEKVILNKIRKHEAQNNITIDEQFGFREKHNTVQQVVRIVNDIRCNFNKGNVTVMLLLDIEKAFDKVWMDGLLYKMIQCNYPITIIRLIQSYLYDRKLQVRVNNVNSEEKVIRAGVPQGSVLGPALFSIYINDIVQFEKTKLAMFADDTAIYAHSFSAIVAAKQIQIHIDLLQEYYTKWKIALNAAKTEMIVFTRKIKDSQIIQPVKIYNQEEICKSTVKYLGVNLDYKLTYKIHIKTTLNKIYAVMKQLYPLMVKDSTVSRCNKILIYKMILRPVLTYAAAVWCGTAKTNLKPLQSFQNKCLRLILNAGRYSRIAELHEQTQIPYIKEYIYNIAERFYNTQLEHNNLTKDITQLRDSNMPKHFKYEVPYQKLNIFYKAL
ncbi:putative RNA-directed DNA polymerase from transposon X-element [Formica fusca]